MEEGGGGLWRIMFSSGDWIIGEGKMRVVLYAGCRLVVCDQEVAYPPILEHKNTTPQSASASHTPRRGGPHTNKHQVSIGIDLMQGCCF